MKKISNILLLLMVFFGAMISFVYAAVPTVPDGLIAKSAGTSKVNIAWQDRSADETGFKIYRKSGTGAFALITTTASNATSYSDTTASGNNSTTSYSYYIKACNASGCSAATQTALVPFKPAALKKGITASTANDVTLNWTDKSLNETAMAVERKAGICAQGGAWVQIQTLAADSTSHTDTTAAAGKIYSYRIRSMVQSAAAPYAYGYSLFSNCVDVVVPVAQLPKTGQTSCYNMDGAAVACAGTRQDGELQTGAAWPATRFVSGVGSETDCIIDQLTGLMWPKDGYLMYDIWKNSLDYANSLDLCGHTDWRMPNVLELESLINAEYYRSDNWLNSLGFYNVQLRYWTSSSIAYAPDRAWVINMGGMTMDEYRKDSDKLAMLPVRAGISGAYNSSVILLPKTGQTACYDSSGSAIACAGTGQDGDIKAGQAWPSPRFSVIYCDYNAPCSSQASDCDAVADNDIVADRLTGLIWPRNMSFSRNQWYWALNPGNLCGYTDWCLPNRRELASLVDWSQSEPALPVTNPFTGLTPLTVPFWTSTSFAWYPQCASTVSLGYGPMELDGKYGLEHYIYVRGGR